MAQSYAFSKELFLAQDGTPMQFHLSRCRDKEELEDYIKYGGGSVVERPGPYTVIIEDAPQDPQTVFHDSFQSEFIIQCCCQNKILSLKQFRSNSVSLFVDDFDPNDVLLHKIRWMDGRRKYKSAAEDSESDESIAEDDVESDTRSKKSSRNSRAEFTREERQRMVQFIRQQKAYTELKGTALWKRMEPTFENHSWQSLKEHFLKKVMPLIHSFKLSEDELRAFRYGAKSGQNSKKRVNKKISSSAYSSKEDKSILKYVSTHATKSTPLSGNQFWMTMQKKSPIPGRTWQSVRERFTKYLKDKKLSDYKSDETASDFDTNENEIVPSRPEEASTSACRKRDSSALGNVSSSAWLTKDVSSTPGTASISVCKIKSVPLIPEKVSSAGKMNNVPSTPEEASSSTNNMKSAPSTPREPSPSSARKENRQNDAEGSPIPCKKQKRRLFHAATAIIPEFSPLTVKATGPSWLEKKFNNTKNKKFEKLVAMISEKQDELKDAPEHLPDNDDTQKDEDVPNRSGGDLVASPSKNQEATFSREQNEQSEICGSDLIPIPANGDVDLQKDEDVQNLGRVDHFAFPSMNHQAESSRKEGEKLLVEHRSSDGDQGTESEWPSNFPPEIVVFISDSENDPTDEGFEGDGEDENKDVESDSEWSDDGLFWRGGVVFPDGVRKKRDPIAHPNLVRLADLNTHNETEEHSKANNRNQSEVEKQDCPRSKCNPPKNTSMAAPKTIPHQSKNEKGRNVTYDFVNLSNSYDVFQMSVNSCNQTAQHVHQASDSQSVVTPSHEQSQQFKNSLTKESNSPSQNCEKPINDKFMSVGVQFASGNKRHVSVQTDPVLILPKNWMDML
ncbi:uncharacterized protein LOC117641685 [Thrips palmi]|uniref:Telomeric repeat-binding factor 2-interacting protein 1 n=1 Tax=Thrips palmi TaxID=161013 RepID=A0A6P8YM53_THRPL|nr:uncharacterized protein LOC117641685 [Thrips palmi]